MNDSTARLRKMHSRITALQASIEGHLKDSEDVSAGLEDALKLQSLLIEDYIPKEEALLRTLEKHLDGGMGSLSILFADHEKILRILKQLIRSLQKERKPRTRVKEGGQLSLLQDLRLILEEHFSKEENVVYWLANLRLTQPEKLQLTR